MSLELTDSLQSFVDSASTQQGFVSGNEYILHVLQKEQDRARVRALIEEGEASPAEKCTSENPKLSR
ncbi:MAG: type II toxin-antitoxin system ParD family antitoxin [Alcaligenaceae bacterium]